jgi:hypothetical protein
MNATSARIDAAHDVDHGLELLQTQPLLLEFRGGSRGCGPAPRPGTNANRPSATASRCNSPSERVSNRRLIISAWGAPGVDQPAGELHHRAVGVRVPKRPVSVTRPGVEAGRELPVQRHVQSPEDLVDDLHGGCGTWRDDLQVTEPVG